MYASPTNSPLITHRYICLPVNAGAGMGYGIEQSYRLVIRSDSTELRPVYVLRCKPNGMHPKIHFPLSGAVDQRRSKHQCPDSFGIEIKMPKSRADPLALFYPAS